MRHGSAQQIAILLISLIVAGCGSGDSSQNGAGAADPHAGHSHDHDHSHAEGPHGGHVLELGEEEYHAEWTHEDTGKITIYLLDKHIKEEVAIDADAIVIETAVENGEGGSYSLNAVREDGATTTSKFEIIDKILMTTLQVAGEGATATLKVTIAGKEFAAEFEHDDHGHAH